MRVSHHLTENNNPELAGEHYRRCANLNGAVPKLTRVVNEMNRIRLGTCFGKYKNARTPQYIFSVG